MQPLRENPKRDLTLSILAGVVIALLYTFCGYLLYLNHRITSELANHSWAKATEIYSDKNPSKPVLKVYGSDWRVTTPVEIEEIPDTVSNAFLAAEDIRFRKHIGVDPIGIARAMFTNVRAGGIAQGGSTIDQQIIKAQFLTASRTYRRKFVEMILAVVLDFRLSKDEILEAYLNDVYLGHVAGRAVLGIDEAARIYFDKEPAELRVDEAALLAGIIRAPNRDTPDKRPDLAKARRDTILARMKNQKWITEEQYRLAIERPVRFKQGTAEQTPFPYYMAALRAEVAEQVGEGTMKQSGLKVVCGLDPDMQRAAERAVVRGVDSLRRKYPWIRSASREAPLQSAVLSVDPATGAIRALVGGSDFRVTPYDRTRQMRRQPGSAFKTFAFLAAIESRSYTNSSLLLDTPLEVRLASNKTWEPHNYDEQFRGRVTVRESFEKSLNVPTVRMANSLGRSRVATVANRFGFDKDFPELPALPLGVVEVSMRDLTSAYTVFPNLGTRVEPYLVGKITNGREKVLYQVEVKREKIAEPAPAYVVHSLLRGVVRRGTASRLRRYDLGFVAGKTGTTSDYRDAWFVGYTRDVVTSVWVGFDKGTPLRLSSAEAALPIWGTYMSDVKLDRRDIAPPAGVVERLIDPESGYLWDEGCPGPLRETYLSGTAPTRRCPRGMLGKMLRRAFFDEDSFDEPPAITFEKFRRWAHEVDQDRQRVENFFDRLERILKDE